MEEESKIPSNIVRSFGVSVESAFCLFRFIMGGVRSSDEKLYRCVCWEFFWPFAFVYFSFC